MAKVLDGVDLNAPALLKNRQYQKAIGTIAQLAVEQKLGQIVKDWQRHAGSLLSATGRAVTFFGGSFKAQVAEDGQLSLQFIDTEGRLSSTGTGSMSLSLHSLPGYLATAAGGQVLLLKYQAMTELAGLATVYRPDSYPSGQELRQARAAANEAIPGGLDKLVERTVQAVKGLLDQDVVAIAQRYSPGRATLHTYNFIAKNRAAFEKLYQEAPQLLPLLHKAVSERVIRRIDLNAFQTLKQVVRESGYSEAVWKTLSRMPAELLDRLTRDCSLLGCIRVASLAAEVGVTPPADLLYYWLHHSERSPMPLWFRRAAAMHANGLHSRVEIERFVNQYATAVNWANALQVRPDANQMKAGWGWIQRQTEAWLEEVRQVNSGRDCSWTTLVAEYVTGKGKYRIVPLTSSSQLRDEGNRMSNCVGRYGYDRKCLAGSSRIFSVRAAGSGKSLATVELCQHRGGWYLNAIKASHNQAAKDCHAALMPELVKKYNEAYSRVFAEATPETSGA